MISIGLCNIKDPNNFGSICRLAGCYGAQSVLYQGIRFQRHPTDTSKYYKHHSVIKVNNLIDSRPFGTTPVGIELVENSINLTEFKHPKNAFFLVGAEDSGINKNILDKCHFIVQIPTRLCLNVAMALNIVLYDRVTKGIKDK